MFAVAVMVLLGATLARADGGTPSDGGMKTATTSPKIDVRLEQVDARLRALESMHGGPDVWAIGDGGGVGLPFPRRALPV